MWNDGAIKPQQCQKCANYNHALHSIVRQKLENLISNTLYLPANDRNKLICMSRQQGTTVLYIYSTVVPCYLFFTYGVQCTDLWWRWERRRCLGQLTSFLVTTTASCVTFPDVPCMPDDSADNCNEPVASEIEELTSVPVSNAGFDVVPSRRTMSEILRFASVSVPSSTVSPSSLTISKLTSESSVSFTMPVTLPASIAKCQRYKTAVTQPVIRQQKAVSQCIMTSDMT